MSASQAEHAGSIPVICSKKEGHPVWMSFFFFKLGGFTRTRRFACVLPFFDAGILLSFEKESRQRKHSRSAQEGLQIFLHGGDAADAELLHQHLGHVGAEEGGQGGAQMDILHAQI